MYYLNSKGVIVNTTFHIWLPSANFSARVLLNELDKRLFSHQSSPSKAAEESSRQPTERQLGLDQPCFTKKEVRDILFERNELKTNLFLVQEELNYYQRWVRCTSGQALVERVCGFYRFECVCREILNEERCPGFLLEAVRSAIKKKRHLIKAKMLGIPASECNSRLDSCFASHVQDCQQKLVQKVRSFYVFPSPVMMKTGVLALGRQKWTEQQRTKLTDRLSHALDTCEFTFRTLV